MLKKQNEMKFSKRKTQRMGKKRGNQQQLYDMGFSSE